MAMTKVKGLQMWCQRRLEGYRDVAVRDMTSSWKSGLAFCALIHNFRPDLIDYDSLSKENIFENNQLAFEVAERELGIPALLEAQDMVDIRVPDRLSVVTYVSQYYNYFRDAPQLGGPGVSAAQTSSSPAKRSPAVQPAPGQEVKRFAPTNDKNVTKTTPKSEYVKKTSTIGDKCVICQNKVYLLERQIEDGKLYHRSCFRHSELSPTAKVFKSSHETEDFGSKAKVRKTEEAPSFTKSNRLAHTNGNSEDSRKSLFSSQTKSEPSKPDPLLERLKSRMVEPEKKESEIPSYKKNIPLILQTGSKESEKKPQPKSPEPSFNAKKFEKHEFGFLSKTSKADDKKTEDKKFNSTQNESKDTTSSSKSTFPVAKLRHVGEKETPKVEKMDTSESFGAKLKHVSPPSSRKTILSDANKSKKTEEKKSRSPLFGKKLLISKDKSQTKETAKTPDSPPPLPTSQPPAKLATKISPREEFAPKIPSSLPPSLPKSQPPSEPHPVLRKVTETSVSHSSSADKPSYVKSTTTTTKSILKTTPASGTTSSSTSHLSTTTTSIATKGILKTTQPTTNTSSKTSTSSSTTTSTATKGILKTTTTTSAPSKPPRLFIEEKGGRSESPMDIDEALHKAAHPVPGEDPVAVLVVPTEKNPVQEKRVLGGLLASLANVRKKPDDVKSPTETSPERPPPLAKARSNVKSEIIVSSTKTDKDNSKSKFGLDFLKTKTEVKESKTKETEKKENRPYSVDFEKKGLFDKNDKSKEVQMRSGTKSSDLSSRHTSAIEPSTKYSSKFLSSDLSDVKMRDKKPTEESVPSWKKDSALKDQKTSKNIQLQDSKLSSSKPKDNDSVPSWKKELEKQKDEKSKSRETNLLLDSRTKQSKPDNSEHLPLWKQKLQKDQKISDTVLDTKSKPSSDSDDDIPEWKKALEKRKAEKSRPKSADILLMEETGRSDIPERRVKDKEETLKARPKSSAAILDNGGKLSWQMEAERRIAHNKGGFVDPEKILSKGDSKERFVPQKKPRTVISQLEGDSTDPKPKLRVPVRPTNPPASPPVSPPVGRQLKKISIGEKFEFKTPTPAGEKKTEVTSPFRTPPARPPPPHTGNLKQPVSPGRMSPAIIQRQLNDIDSKLTDLELRGRHLEDSIRSVVTTEEEDDMMIEWFNLINSKNELVRKEADLIYISKQQELEDEQEDIDSMLRYLMGIPDSDKTESQRKREENLLEKKMSIVNERNNIVDSIDEDRIRYEEEDKDIASMLEEKGFTQTSPGQMEKKKEKSKPRKGAFVSYMNNA